MDRNRTPLFWSPLFFLLCFSTAEAQSCSSYTFSSNKVFSSCNDLTYLNAYLYWNHQSGSKTADIAFRVTGVSSSEWVAWAINPSGKSMVGSQAIVAFQNSSGVMHAYTSSVTSYTTQLAESSLSFSVSKISAERTGNQVIIYATVDLPSTTVNQVWQVGPVSGDTPQQHPTSGDNVKSVGTVNFLSGQVSSGGTVDSRLKRKNVHGVLNAVSWGTLMPIGAIIARYMRVFKSADPAWFYLHIACQTSAYAVGVAGWGTGLKLGSDSPGVVYHAHRNIGITLFCLATLQVFALLLRPKKDHKYRFHWNIYHYVIGYTVIILSIINIFKGLDILDPAKKWKRAYIGIIIFLGCVALFLEAVTWMVVLKRKKGGEAADKYHQSHTGSGTNGTNGYA